ncbi:MAG: hypothetical protein ACKVOH_04445, partial [Chlamydiales bacterium]
KVLAKAPGMLFAFLQAGIIDPKTKSEEKVAVIEELLVPLKEQLENPFTIITADQILSAVLMNVYEVTDKELSKHKEQAEGRMLFPPHTRRGKQVSCARYLESLAAARAAYKGMTDNALLKAWEFTLASLSESKADFAKWNLYSSLGLHPEEEGGIGATLAQIIQQKIVEVNSEIEEYQSKYDHLFGQAKYLEGRMRRVESERDANWISAEYYMRKQELNRVLVERDKAHDRGLRLNQLFQHMIKFVSEKIKEYFQEVYESEMHEMSCGPYDDSPAGFRLLYKHGRTNSALWTLIQNEGEYLVALTSFFLAIEVELTTSELAQGMGRQVGEMITAIIRTIQEPNFLESSLYRLAKAYNERIVAKPLEHLDRVQRKPWAYISGGTMSTLVSCYYANSKTPTESTRWVESPTELLAFLIDTVKDLPLSVQNKFPSGSENALLGFSPTHAYQIKPGYPSFNESWDNDVYTYTWIRDHCVTPAEDFLDGNKLDTRMMDALIERLFAFIPAGYRPVVRSALNHLPSSLYPFDFREQVQQILSYEKWLAQGLQRVIDELDSILYSSLPFIPEYQLREKLAMIFEEMEEIYPTLKEQLMNHFDELEPEIGRYKLFSSHEVCSVAKGLLIMTLETTRTPIPYHQRIILAMQRVGLRQPAPLIFGDTNWVKQRFAFVVNPGSRELELWCVDNCGSEGRPLSIWRPYLNGTKKGDWGIYCSPKEYGQF